MLRKIRKFAYVSLAMLFLYTICNLNLNCINSYVTINSRYANFIRMNIVSDRKDKSILLKRAITTTVQFCNKSTKELSNQTDFPEYYGKVMPNKTAIEEMHRILLKSHKDLADNGYWAPTDCKPTNDVAVVIPFKNRDEHLVVLLTVLLPLLKKQNIQFKIFVVEQSGNGTFNKGRLMNAGYKFVDEFYPDFTCIVFHDVDLIPENEQNYYNCNSVMPKHMSPAVSTLEYKLPYEGLVGGVLAITKEHFWKVNGYSNSYWGWGGEDDDFYTRLKAENFSIERPSTDVGKYTMLGHLQRPQEAHNLKLLDKAIKRYKIDGVQQLNETGAFVVEHLFKKLYTHVVVDVGQVQKLSAEEYNNVVEVKETDSYNYPITPRPNIWMMFRKI